MFAAELAGVVERTEIPLGSVLEFIFWRVTIRSEDDVGEYHGILIRENSDQLFFVVRRSK